MLKKDVFQRIFHLLMGEYCEIFHISRLKISTEKNLTMKKAIGSVKNTAELVKTIFHLFKKVISLS